MKELTNWIAAGAKYSVVLKMFVIAVLILIFLLPLGMISGIILEREMTRSFAENDIIGMWGGDQVLGGPFLTVPYIVRRKDDEGNIQEFKQIRFLVEGQERPTLAGHVSIREPFM